MKVKSLFSLLLFTALYSCTFFTEKQTKIISNSKKDIHTILDNWHLAAAKADFKTYMKAMDSSSFFIGTDASEHWTKHQFKIFSKPYFDKGKAWNFKPLKRNIFINNSNNIAWFDELLNTWMGTCRGSGVLEKINNKWKIKHYVLSVTIPNLSIKEVIKAKKANDSLFLQSLITTHK